ncbi:MAG: EamA family transporter [Deltaproteobacteria bacterium]|nr:EamA family transporter [Deltaproteobacteria bacterium]
MAAFAYASVSVSSRLGLQYSTPLTATCVAMVVRMTLLWCAVAVTGGVPAVAGLAFLLFVLLGVMQALTSYLSFTGVARIGASRSQPLRTTYPLWSAGWSVALLGESLTPGLMSGTVLVVAGTVLISWSPDRAADQGQGTEGPRPAAGTAVPRQHWWYIVFPLSAAFLAGIAFPVRRYALDISNQPLFFAAVLATVAAVCLAISLCAGGIHGRFLWNRRALWPFVVAGTFETVASLFSLIAVSMGQVVAVAPLVATSPLWTQVLALLFLRGVERLNVRSVTGTVAVVAGTVTIIAAR